VRALSVSEYSASVNWPGWAVEGNADWHEEAAGGNCNWFQKEIRSGLDGRGSYLKRKANWLGKGES